MLLVPYCF